MFFFFIQNLKYNLCVVIIITLCVGINTSIYYLWDFRQSPFCPVFIFNLLSNFWILHLLFVYLILVVSVWWTSKITKTFFKI